MKKKKRLEAAGVTAYGVFSNLCFTLRETAAAAPQLYLSYGVLIACGVFLPLLSAYLPKYVLQEIETQAKLSHIAGTVLLFMGGIALCTALKTYLTKYSFFRKLWMNTHYLRMVTRKGLTTDYENQEREVFRRLQSESLSICNGNYSQATAIYDCMTALLTSLLGFLSYSGILMRLHPGILLFLSVTTVISYFCNERIVRWEAAQNDVRVRHRQRVGYLNTVTGDVRSAKDIRLYDMTMWLDQVYRQHMEELGNWYRRYTKKLFGVAVWDGILGLFREAAVYGYLILLVLRDEISIADFTLYFGLVTGFSVWLSGLLGQISVLQRISRSFDRLRSYLDYPSAYGEEGQSCTHLLNTPRELMLSHVCYRYDGAETDTLRDISLRIQPGEHLAIVGLNGAGKTTLVKLLCGLANPTSGEITYDGIPIRAYQRREYYDLFSTLFQQHSLLPVTIAELVAALPPEETDRARVAECLQQAGLWERIAALPAGMDSYYFKTIHDDGVEFSGGEIQKLLLARALYRNAPMMILDEPTAALDPLAENRLYEAYHTLMRGHTAVFISHRLASTRFCDRILLMEDGEIRETGTHESLLAQRGRYYTLFEAQAKYYREKSSNEEAEV